MRWLTPFRRVFSICCFPSVDFGHLIFQRRGMPSHLPTNLVLSLSQKPVSPHSCVCAVTGGRHMLGCSYSASLVLFLSSSLNPGGPCPLLPGKWVARGPDFDPVCGDKFWCQAQTGMGSGCSVSPHIHAFSRSWASTQSKASHPERAMPPAGPAQLCWLPPHVPTAPPVSSHCPAQNQRL